MKPVHELTTDQAVAELERVCDQLMERSTPTLLARQHELEAWILMHQVPTTTPTEEPTKDPDPMRKRKTRTAEEKAALKLEYQRNWRAKKLAAEGKPPAVKRKAAKPDQKRTTPAKVVHSEPKASCRQKIAVEEAAPSQRPLVQLDFQTETIAALRSSIWRLMAEIEHMRPEQKEALANDLAMLDVAAHAAHQLALGRLEVA